MPTRRKPVQSRSPRSARPVRPGAGERKTRTGERRASRAERPAHPKHARAKRLVIKVDPVESAEAASCRYVDDSQPGIIRKKRGTGFSYTRADGKAVHDAVTLRRIKSLVIPPAWTNVWICPHADGHIQATGRDARGRKQYRYHARFRQVREETKYERMMAFAEALPKIRAQVDEDVARTSLCREKVLATVVRLLEITLIRVGNEEYARQNQSFGLTTMRDRHVDVRGSTIAFHFRGKSKKEHVVQVHDRRLARIVARCHDLPGEVLFQYPDEQGELHSVEASDVNEYLKAVAGADFTAKDFRTWAGTVLAAQALKELSEFDSQAAAKRNIVQAVKDVSARLGNTPTVCRKCYVHPQIFDAYLDGQLVAQLRERAEEEIRDNLAELSSAEAAVLVLLRDRLAKLAPAHARAA